MDTKSFVNKTAQLLEEIDSSFRIVNSRSKDELVDALLVQHLGFRVKQGQWSRYCDEVTVLDAVAFMFKEFGIRVFQDNRDMVILDEKNNLYLLYAVKKEPYVHPAVNFGMMPIGFVPLTYPSPDEQSKCAIFVKDIATNYIWKEGEVFRLTGKGEKVNEFLKTRDEVIQAGRKRLEELGVVNYLWGAP